MNLFDKIWEAHTVESGLLYIDLHLIHEVTSPQAFARLREEGRVLKLRLSKVQGILARPWV